MKKFYFKKWFFVCLASFFVLADSISFAARYPFGDGSKNYISEYGVTRDFGVYVSSPWNGYHLGVDINASSGTKLYAITSGVVKISNDRSWSGYGSDDKSKSDYAGYMLVVENINRGVTILYGHVKNGEYNETSEVGLIPNGAIVREGQYIATIADFWHYENGVRIANWDHLHLGIRLGLFDPNNTVNFIRGYSINGENVDERGGKWINPLHFIESFQVGIDQSGNFNQAIGNAYTKNEGYDRLGLPFDNGGGKNVHPWYGGMLVQDLESVACKNSTCVKPSPTGKEPYGTDGQTMIIYGPGLEAHLLKEVFFCVYKGADKSICSADKTIFGPTDLGYPLEDETTKIENGKSISIQHFQRGTLRWNGTIVTVTLEDNSNYQKLISKIKSVNELDPYAVTVAYTAPKDVASSSATKVASIVPMINITSSSTVSVSADSKFNNCYNYYQDLDNDGYSNGTMINGACSQPTGYQLASALIQTTGDCNDNNYGVNPRAIEVINGIDDNCNKTIDESYVLATYTVCPVGCNYTSIQTAMNISKHGDTVLVSDGKYNEQLFFNGKNITVKSVNGRDSTIIDASNKIGGVIYIEKFATSGTILNGFTIQNGNSRSSGGGISISENSSPVLKNLKIINNTTFGNGGGISISGGSPNLSNIIVSNNKAIYGNGGSGVGGGIYLSDSKAIITDCVVSNNYVERGGGGGVYVEGSDGRALISNCVIENNTGKGAGGVMVRETSLTVDNTSIINNQGSGGGGMSFMNINTKVSSTPKYVLVKNSVISGNSVSLIYEQYGGGVLLANSNVDFANVIITRNSANQGGGMYLGASTANIDTTTIGSNTAYQGGGIYSNNSTSTFNNLSLLNNSATNVGGGFWISGGIISLYDSNITSNTAVVNGNGIYFQSGGTVNLTSSPMTDISYLGTSGVVRVY